jgi:hypothetical protein
VKRRIEQEWLDQLPADDPSAIWSRKDLRRVNAFMGNARIVARALQDNFSRHLSLRLLDLGAGDGEFMLRVARRVSGKWRRVEATLVDRQELLTSATHARFAQVNWNVESAKHDVFLWLSQVVAESDAVVANLFLHHFTDDQLRELFHEAARSGRVLIAVEPRRTGPALFFSRFLWLIGCNAVTRHDALTSVRAGFNGRELSALWPDLENWELTERPAGWCSHLFIARRKEPVETSLFQSIASAVFNPPPASHPEASMDPPPDSGLPERRDADHESAPPRGG